ncbi:septum formation family protein [Krasilnikovia sp. MM14-A1004]|uniref:DUF4190 domain-containing protein n=1 Tax=Krasilnikovia sp. MM14-A1004 TaxID=3373541 RepID=UPI00399D2D39
MPHDITPPDPSSGPVSGPPEGERPAGEQHVDGPAPTPGPNAFAIGSLTLGVLSGASLGTALVADRLRPGVAVAVLGGLVVSAVLGIVALVQLRSRHQRGRGPALGGLIVSGCCVAIIANTMSPADPPGTAADDGSLVEAARLEPGDCVERYIETGTVEHLPTVSCSTPHQAEVFAAFDLPFGPWPGEEVVQKQAGDRCTDELDSYATDPADSLDLVSLQPMVDFWPRHRRVTCLAVERDGKRTGSLHN